MPAMMMRRPADTPRRISYSIKRLDALSWTSHMDECLQELSQQREWEGDDLLVAQVKVQVIVEQLTRATSQSHDGIPPAYVLSTLRTQLQNTKAQLPIHLQHNGNAIIENASHYIANVLQTPSSATSLTQNSLSTRLP